MQGKQANAGVTAPFWAFELFPDDNSHTVCSVWTKCRSRILKAWSQTLEKCDQTDVEHQPLSIWWETPTMTQTHPSTDERGVPSNSPAQWRQGLSLPAARHAYTHTFPSAHTEKKVTPGWHTRSRQSWLIWQGRDKRSYMHTSTQWNARAHTHTHTEHGQCNQCQLSLLSKAAMGLQSVIVTLLWHTHCLDFHSHVNACKHTKSKKTLPRYFMVICLVSGFAFTVFFWLRALRTTQFYPLWHVLIFIGIQTVEFIS